MFGALDQSSIMKPKPPTVDRKLDVSSSYYIVHFLPRPRKLRASAAHAHQSQSQHLKFDSNILNCSAGDEEVRHHHQSAHHHGQWQCAPRVASSASDWVIRTLRTGLGTKPPCWSWQGRHSTIILKICFIQV